MDTNPGIFGYLTEREFASLHLYKSFATSESVSNSCTGVTRSTFGDLGKVHSLPVEIIVTKNFKWWNPMHYTDDELWAPTFTDPETARSRCSSSAFHSISGSFTSAQTRWSSIKRPDTELHFLTELVMLVRAVRRVEAGAFRTKI